MEKTALDILLAGEKQLPVQEKQFRLKRLDIVLTLKSLSYSRVQEIKKIGTDIQLHQVLAGVRDPDLKNQALLDHYGAATPIELVQLMFSAGEIEEICFEIDRLSGYRQVTLEAVKKN